MAPFGKPEVQSPFTNHYSQSEVRWPVAHILLVRVAGQGHFSIMRFPLLFSLGALSVLHAEPAPLVTGVDVQPPAAHARRMVEAAEFLGEPFSPAQVQAIEATAVLPDAAQSTAKIQAVFEVIVNGFAVARQNIVADGTLRDVKFTEQREHSSWVALRVLAGSHTNPVLVVIGKKPICPSRRSLEWCLKAVDQCWSQKEKTYAPAEQEEAVAAYEHARQVCRARLAETDGR